MLRRLLFAASLAAIVGLSAIALAQQPPVVTPMTPEMNPTYKFERPDADYVRTEVMIPMRDGTKLFTVIAMHKGTKNAPILLTRTVYNAGRATSRMASQRLVDILPVMDAEFVNDGYIRVYQDARGRNKSEGEFVMNRPIIGPLNKTTVDESTDAYDTIDWLVKNVPESNGKVGITGSSYLGFTSLVATINPHPALKASVPQSPMVDGWMGDDWFHNGAFRQPNFDYVTSMTTNAGDSNNVPNGSGDDYANFLAAGSAGDYAKKFGLDSYPFVQKLFQNPAYTSFWSDQAVDKWFKDKPLTVPTMLVVGQWDQEDSYGAPAAYKMLEPKDTNNDKLHLVIGPWRHSGVNYPATELGFYKLPGDTGLDFRSRYMKPFLDHYLKGAPDPKTPPVLTYQTGINKWNETQKWPGGVATPLYLQANGELGWTKPTAAATAHDEYVSDPAKPVPYVPRPVHLRDRLSWTTWLIADQRFVSGRPDVLEYTTPALGADVHIMGAPQVNLFAATSGSDSDWVVKLIDVYPDEDTYAPETAGVQMGIGFEIFRGRYVKDFAKPEALKPGKVEEFKFGLPNVDHVFRKGHKIMVQVQSTLFPLYDRNPQTFVPNIFYAKAADYKKATQSIYRSAAQPSAVVLPVVK
ncbi:MAG: CocE/NonD family hydrolase [Hyphomonadaceae bacterium]